MTAAVTPNLGGPTELAPKEEILELRTCIFSIPHQPALGNTSLLSCVLYYCPSSLRDTELKPPSLTR